MDSNKTYIFDGNLEGFLTIVFLFYYDSIRPTDIIDEFNAKLTLGTTYITVVTDEQKSKRVLNGITSKISNSFFEFIYVAFLCDDDSRYFDLFRLIIQGFKQGESALDRLDLDFVLKSHSYHRLAIKESYKLREFLRFKQTQNDIYYAEISPENNILILICDHFIDRFRTMNFIIHDLKRNIAAIYNTNECVFRETPTNLNVIYSENELEYQKLWHGFFESITNEQRINTKLQTAFLPKKFRKHIVEFNFELNKHYEENKQQLPVQSNHHLESN